jgi:hypothetical protein
MSEGLLEDQFLTGLNLPKIRYSLETSLVEQRERNENEARDDRNKPM